MEVAITSILETECDNCDADETAYLVDFIVDGQKHQAIYRISLHDALGFIGYNIDKEFFKQLPGQYKLCHSLVGWIVKYSGKEEVKFPIKFDAVAEDMN